MPEPRTTIPPTIAHVVSTSPSPVAVAHMASANESRCRAAHHRKNGTVSGQETSPPLPRTAAATGAEKGYTDLEMVLATVRGGPPSP